MVSSSVNLRAEAVLSCKEDEEKEDVASPLLNLVNERSNRSFQKNQRLTLSKDIRWLIQTGEKYVASFMILHARRMGEGPLKATFIASKRVGPAVIRNRVKRLMREAFRNQKHLFNQGCWLVFIARPKKDRDAWKQKMVFEQMAGLAKQINP
jgi:ribonuclease P protein component